MKHLYGGMNFQELRSAIDKQTSSLVQVKRVFSPIAVGSLVRVHMLEVTHDAPEGASLNIYHDYYKGVLDLYTPDMLKIIVRTELENEPTNIRIDIEQVIDAPVVLKSFDFDDDDNKEHVWVPGVLSTDNEKPKSDYIQDIIEYLDDQDTGKLFYIIEVI